MELGELESPATSLQERYSAIEIQPHSGGIGRNQTSASKFQTWDSVIKSQPQSLVAQMISHAFSTQATHILWFFSRSYVIKSVSTVTRFGGICYFFIFFFHFFHYISPRTPVVVCPLSEKGDDV